MTMPAQGGVLEVEFVPGERTTHSVRLAVHNLVLLSTENRPLAGRLMVTCAELVETLGKRIAPPTKICLKLSLGTAGARVEASTDVAEASAPSIERALHLANQGTPIEAYTQALVHEEAEGQLGLARIRYEGQMILSTRRTGRQLALMAQSIA
jgi:hypothetical protein